jgi:SNF2 family DNA or RNA helicase
MTSFASKPSNFDFLKSLRASKTASLKPCPLIKPETALRYYQVIGCLHLLCLSRMILGDAVGLGKTVQLIAAYAYMVLKDPGIKLLVVTPKSAMFQWEQEFRKFTTGITVHVLREKYAVSKDGKVYGTVEDMKASGKPFRTLSNFEARKAQYDHVDAQVFITGYFSVQEDYEFLIANRGPKFAVAYDEAQAFKNDSTKTFFGAEKIAQAASRVYGMSATLIKNRLEEAYNIYKVVVPGLFGGKQSFYQRYTIRKKRSIYRKGRKRYFQEIVGYQNLDEFKDKIDPYFLIRRTREVAAELPHLVSKRVDIEMFPEQQTLYKQALSGELYRKVVKQRYFDLKEKIEANPSPSDRDLEILSKLEKQYDVSMTTVGLQDSKIAALTFCQLVANGPAWVREEGDSAKEAEFKRLFDEELKDEKTIVFTRFKSGIVRLEGILDALDLKHVRIDGDMGSKERLDAQNKFQDMSQGIDVMFITTAGSAAINLQSANVILFYDTPWSYGDLYQTIGRAQRIGSVYDHICLIHMVCRGTIDEHVIKILDSKKTLIKDVMGDIAEGAIEFKDQDLFSGKSSEPEIDELFHSVFG